MGAFPRVRVTFLRGEDDAKDDWERAEGNEGEQRNKKQAQEEQVWVGEEKPTGRCAQGAVAVSPEPDGGEAGDQRGAFACAGAHSALRSAPKLAPSDHDRPGYAEPIGDDMRALPAHPSAFESCLDYRFVRTLHTATAKRPAQLLVKWILHLLLTLTQVVHLSLQIRHVRMLLQQKTNFLENRCGTLVLEIVALLANPTVVSKL